MNDTLEVRPIASMLEIARHADNPVVNITSPVVINSDYLSVCPNLIGTDIVH